MKFLKVVFSATLCLSLFSGSLFSSAAFAKEKIKNLDKIKKVIVERVSGIGSFDVQPSPVKGLYMVIAPPRVLYISEDAKFIIDGDISDVQTGENKTEGFRNFSRFSAIDSLKESMIVFSPPEDKVKHTISVFTDTDCYYCQKLHKEMKEYNHLGIKVRYLAYPRQGLESPGYKKSVTVWCSKDQKNAMTRAKNGEQLKQKECDNPVQKHYALGNMLGVRGTPALLLENGQLYPGYVPAAKLAAALDRAKASMARK